MLMNALVLTTSLGTVIKPTLGWFQLSSVFPLFLAPLLQEGYLMYFLFILSDSEFVLTLTDRQFSLCMFCFTEFHS